MFRAPASFVVVTIVVGVASLAGCGRSTPAPIPKPAPPSSPPVTPSAAVATTPAAKAAPSAEPYVFAPASPDGIGKFYFGREIAQVMGHEAADWLDRSERTQEERTDLLIDLLDLAPDAVVADIGAGSGTLTFPIARHLPRGRVVAVDIQPEMLTLIADRADAANIENIELILGAIDDARLAPSSVDLVLFVDAYHEFSHPKEMLESIVRGLRPGGRVVQVEYRANDPEVPIKPLHTMTEAQSRRELEAAGLRWIRTRGDLPRQHVLIFEKPASMPVTGIEPALPVRGNGF